MSDYLPGWATRTAVVIASGPSLTKDDCMFVRARRADDTIRVISVSNAWKHCADFADVFFAADQRYWTEYLPAMLAEGIERDRIYTCCSVSAQRHQLHRVKIRNGKGLGVDVMHHGSNSGFMGVNFAFLRGARRIVLLGFDMQLGEQGEEHFDGSHPRKARSPLLFSEWLHRFEQMKAGLDTHGCTVLNATRRTAIPATTFARVDLKEALA